MQLKTSCSGVRLDIRHRQLEQFKYKDEAQLIAERTRTIHQNRAAVEAEIGKLRGVVGEVREKRTTARLTTKSYEHMLDRMKKDQIRTQMRRNELERDLKRMEKQLTELTVRGYDLKEYEFLSSSGLKEAEEEVRELEGMRQSTVADMHSILEEKEVLGRKRQDRK
jgi:chromosome segregation ATPase